MRTEERSESISFANHILLAYVTISQLTDLIVSRTAAALMLWAQDMSSQFTTAQKRDPSVLITRLLSHQSNWEGKQPETL
jgi:hypothetical protein